MRRVLATLAIVIMLAPTVSAHGANTFAFVMRGESLQPESAQVLQNDTLIFYNVVDHERSILLDIEGDGVNEINCTAGPSSPGTEDECRVWLDPVNWTSGNYEIDIFSNGSIWKTVSLSIVLDNHTESGPRDTAVARGHIDPHPPRALSGGHARESRRVWRHHRKL